MDIRLLSEYYDSFVLNLKEFLANVTKEGTETKEAFYLLVDSINNGTELTEDEKTIIIEQLKDVFKTIGLVSVAALPGASLLFIVTTYLKLNKYILPSSFQEKKQ